MSHEAIVRRQEVGRFPPPTSTQTSSSVAGNLIDIDEFFQGYKIFAHN